MMIPSCFRVRKMIRRATSAGGDGGMKKVSVEFEEF